MQLTARVRPSLRFLAHALAGPARRLHHAREGLAILGMALIMPLVIFLIMLIADVGLLFYGYVSASNALREGARCGAVGYSDAAVVQRVEEAAGFTVPVSVNLSSRAGAGIGDEFVVTGTFEHSWITPVTAGLDLTQYTRAATMRLETDTFDKPDCTV